MQKPSSFYVSYEKISTIFVWCICLSFKRNLTYYFCKNIDLNKKTSWIKKKYSFDFMFLFVFWFPDDDFKMHSLEVFKHSSESLLSTRELKMLL